MKNLFTIALFLLYLTTAHAIEFSKLQQTLNTHSPYLSYPINIKAFKGKTSHENILVCCHGYASNYSLGKIIHDSNVSNNHIVSFNFPDYDIHERGFNYSTVCYGTPYEILPALVLLKTIVVDAGAENVSLYGFSSGGGAVVNIIAALNTPKFDTLLQKWGIDCSDKTKILAALQRGIILLDAPLKSREEISEVNGFSDKEFDFVTERYKANEMRPIDSLASFEGAPLNVVLFFQNPDPSLTNRDDELFAQRLRFYNAKGINKVIIADEGGHCGFHTSLWKAYQQLASSKK
ncbi:MAG: hypothetical protein WC222_01705 [Parachlamydiales bacterium]|jgi:hypothetical protein